jgi:hypothetical protein
VSAEVGVNVSKRNLKHIRKHLFDFQKLDPAISLEDVVDLAQKIAGRPANLLGTSGGRKIFEEMVSIDNKNEG